MFVRVIGGFVFAFLLVAGLSRADAQSFLCSIEDQTVLYDPDDGSGAFTAEVSIVEDPGDPEYPTEACAISLTVIHDATYLSAVAAEPVGDLADLHGGSGPEFFYYSADNTTDMSGIVIDAFFSNDFMTTLVFDGPVVAIDYELVGKGVLDYAASAPAGDDLVTELAFLDEMDPLSGSRGTVIYTFEGGGFFGTLVMHDPEVDNADVFIFADEVDPPPPPPPPPVGDLFIRGDVDGNGALVALADSIYLLRYGFLSGPKPPCMDAADVDNNDIANPLTDVLALLQYAFAGGDPPADPGPEECGEDPGEDAGVDCETPPATCE